MHLIICKQSARSYTQVGIQELQSQVPLLFIKPLWPIEIKASNIMFRMGDNIVFTEFEEAEMQPLSPRKEDSDERFIYVSRELDMPKKWGAPFLCDFGSAVFGNEMNLEDVQSNIYRAPEVILRCRGRTALTPGTWVAWQVIRSRVCR